MANRLKVVGSFQGRNRSDYKYKKAFDQLLTHSSNRTSLRRDADTRIVCPGVGAESLSNAPSRRGVFGRKAYAGHPAENHVPWPADTLTLNNVSKSA